MLAIAGALALLMLMLAVIQSVIRQDIWILVRAAFGYLPMAFIFAGVAIAATGLLVAITDDMSAAVVASLGTEQSDNLLQAVGDAYKNALDEDSGIPLFGVFLGAIILALGAFVLWLEMIIRDAAIYICVFFLPLTFVAMVWPATSRWARRLVELLIAIILAKFVIISILTLATAAIANTGVARKRQHHLRADARRRGDPRPRRLVAVRPPANDPDDGARRCERRPASGRRCRAQPDRPASRPPPATCARRWTGTRGGQRPGAARARAAIYAAAQSRRPSDAASRHRLRRGARPGRSAVTQPAGATAGPASDRRPADPVYADGSARPVAPDNARLARPRSPDGTRPTRPPDAADDAAPPDRRDDARRRSRRLTDAPTDGGER